MKRTQALAFILGCECKPRQCIFEQIWHVTLCCQLTYRKRVNFGQLYQFSHAAMIRSRILVLVKRNAYFLCEKIQTWLTQTGEDNGIILIGRTQDHLATGQFANENMETFYMNMSRSKTALHDRKCVNVSNTRSKSVLMRLKTRIHEFSSF